ncbi:uncharacterized protein LOC143568597 [Bidens hawaiensis]|uniref:uncharacterized protein LOC143568597 n=1 Tax=Bidens hawaiensis TaxID=980011 RepID=UPI00404B12E6
MNRRRQAPENREGHDFDNPFFSDDGSSSREIYERELKREHGDGHRCWDAGIWIDILEFDGTSLDLEGFIYWLATVEELFEFKKVSENKRVPLISTILRGRASTWWQQLKFTRNRLRKSRIVTWAKMKKFFWSNFLPHIFQRLMYQRLQNLKQGSRSILDSVNLFDPLTIPDAHQRTLAFEKQNFRVGGSYSPAPAEGNSGSGGGGPRFVPSHRQVNCKQAGKRHLFIEFEYDQYEGYENSLKYDKEPEYEEKVVTGDVGVCTFVIDSGSYDNLVSKEVVRKLALKTESHPKPYKLQWLKKGGEVTVSKRALVSISVGTTYKDDIWCDVIAIDACHLLLGRPWEFDRSIEHNGRSNTYSFMFGGVKLTLVPSKPKELVTKPSGNYLTISQFEDELKDAERVFVLIGREMSKDPEIPEAMAPLFDKFVDVFPDELPDGLPPLRDILHHIDLEPCAQLPNKTHYRMIPSEHEELRRHIEGLISKGYVRESLSPGVVPALLTTKKDGTWRMCVENHAINKITVRYRFPVSRLDDFLDQISGATIFTKMDLKSRYHHICLRPGDEWKTTFKTRECANIGEHVSHIRQVLTLLRKDSLYAAKKKCVFMAPKVLFLGYVVSGDGIYVDEFKVAAVKQWLTPNSITEAVKHWRHYLFHKEFVLFTDHDSLRHIRSQDKVALKHTRWMAFLEKYTFVVKHKSGVSNRVADTFSRRSNLLVSMRVGVPGCAIRKMSDFLVHDGFLFRGNQFCILNSNLRLQITQELHGEGQVGRDCLDQKLCQAEFAYNHAVNRSPGFSPFQVVYSAQPRGPLDLMSLLVPDSVPKKVKEFVKGLHGIYKAVHDNLIRTNSKYKQAADQKRRHVDFEEGDFVWAVLTKIVFLLGNTINY